MYIVYTRFTVMYMYLCVQRERRSLGDGAENHKISGELLVSTELDSEGVTGVRMILPTNEVHEQYYYGSICGLHMYNVTYVKLIAGDEGRHETIVPLRISFTKLRS
jgi:hypothetical protein